MIGGARKRKAKEEEGQNGNIEMLEREHEGRVRPLPGRKETIFRQRTDKGLFHGVPRLISPRKYNLP